jgi:hypothetical protein
MQVAAVRKPPTIAQSPASDEDDNEESEVQWEKFKNWKMSKTIEDEGQELELEEVRVRDEPEEEDDEDEKPPPMKRQASAVV